MKIEEILKEYSIFRKNMGTVIDKGVYERFWNVGDTGKIEVMNINSPVLERKIEVAKNSVKYLLVLNWVEFIAVSGSVASGFAKDEDDIDIFIVLKNDRAWIYRALILFKNIFHRKIRMWTRDVKDRLCINFITEERDLFLEQDMFNLNEIVSLIPIYNERYFVNILRNNTWLFDKYGISRELLNIEYRRNSIRRYPLYYCINVLFIVPQVLFMFLLNHRPDIKRIRDNFMKGRIEFFPKGFREEKLSCLKSR